MNSPKNIGSYFEIPVRSLPRAMKFYSKIFDLDFKLFEIHGCKMALFPCSKSEGISGALAEGEIYIPSKQGSLVYLSTDNIERTLKRVTDLGGHILFEKADTGDFGLVAEFEDCEGNRIGLHQAKK